MQAFTTLQSRAAPLAVANLDTDVIIRIERLTALPRHGLGPYALEALRFQMDGSENPAFVLNQPMFRGAQIIVGEENFGCGSSREAAVWALVAYGIRCVIAPSFGDIFYSNCIQNGLLPVRLEKPALERLKRKAVEGVVFDVRLAEQVVMAGEEKLCFDIDRLRKDTLLRGFDPISLTLRSMEKIREWQIADSARRSWAWPVDGQDT